MPAFGKHQTGQRLHLSGVGAIYLLQGDDKKIVKVLHPPVGIWEETKQREEIDAFLLRGKLQKKLAGSSENWAPIDQISAMKDGNEDLTIGDSIAQSLPAEHFTTGAYLIMDRYPRTVQSLIDGRVNLNNDDLRNVVAGIIKGLRDIRKTLNRPHGNLRPANVLLANVTDLARATIHLSDPAPDGVLGPASDKKDFADLARILYELVNLHPYQGGTIPRTRDWDELGPHGEDWRKLCNTLFEVGSGHGKPEDGDLDKLLATIDTWRAKPKQSRIPLVAAAVLLLLIAGGIAIYFLTRPPPREFSEANWQKLCLVHESWMRDFEKRMSQPDAKEKFKTDPDLNKFFEKFQKTDYRSPQNIAFLEENAAALDLAVNPPAVVTKKGERPKLTGDSVKLIDQVIDTLTHWPVLDHLENRASEFDKRNWHRVAEGLRSVISSAKPPLPDSKLPLGEQIKRLEKVDLFAGIDSAIQVDHSVRKIDADWTRIQEQLKKLPAGQAVQVPLLEALPAFVDDYPQSAKDIRELSDALDKIEKLLNKLITDLSGQDILYAELAKDPAVQIRKDSALTPDSFRGLSDHAKDYIRIKDDPRALDQWNVRLTGIKNDMIEVITRDAPANDRELGEIKDDFRNLGILIGKTAGIKPIVKNRDQIVSGASAINQALEALVKRCDDHPAYMNQVKFDAFIARQKARMGPGQVPVAIASAARPVQEKWMEGQKALIVATGKRSLEEFRRTHLEDERRFESLDKFYADADQAISATGADGSKLLAAFAGGPTWAADLTFHVAPRYREIELAKLLTKAAPQPENVPEITSGSYIKLRTECTAAYAGICRDALALIGDGVTIAGRLDHLQLRSNEPPGAKALREEYNAWTAYNSPLRSDAEIAKVLNPIAERAKAVLDLELVTDYKALVAKALADPPEIALTAWRGISALPIQKDLPVLKDEDQMESRLTKLIADNGEVVGKAHASRLIQEIQSERPVRWRRYAQVLSSPEAIEDALASRQRFAVTLDPQTDLALVYDDTLYQLHKKLKEFETGHNEQQLKDAAITFREAVQSMRDIAGKENISALLALISKTLESKESSNTGAGPELAKWVPNPNPNASDPVRIFTKGAQKLEFARLEVGGKTIYLCTTEMSLGVFAETVKSSGKFAELDNKGKKDDQAHWFSADRDESGPQVWKIVHGQFLPNDEWLHITPQMGTISDAYYPAGMAPPKPGPNYPMQAISPWSAMFVARLLGCRLPTSEEWKAAYDKFESTGPKDAWNLRGRGWAMQQEHAVAMKKLEYPDSVIYLPASKARTIPTAEKAQPWKSDALAKIAPARITATADVYPASQIWFRPVDQPQSTPVGGGAVTMHDLVGNVAEYVFDEPGANAAIKDTDISVDKVNATLAAGAKSLFVIGGSSLSPPEIPFNEKQPIDLRHAQTDVGFADVGFRLAYTAPIESIGEVLANVFSKSPPYLPGPKAVPNVGAQ